jgi:hypothetical protein
MKRKSKDLQMEEYQDIIDELRLMDVDNLEVYLDSGLDYVNFRANPSGSRYNTLERLMDEDNNDEYNSDDGSDDGRYGLNEGTQWASLPPVNEPPVPDTCGGNFDSTGLVSFDTGIRLGLEDEQPLILHPPSSADDICRFTEEMWKAIFGSRINGDRTMTLTFGEWERKHMCTTIWLQDDSRRQKDLRVRVTAKPHDRDDMKGKCFLTMQCCQGKHWKKWTST